MRAKATGSPSQGQSISPILVDAWEGRFGSDCFAGPGLKPPFLSFRAEHKSKGYRGLSSLVAQTSSGQLVVDARSAELPPKP